MHWCTVMNAPACAAGGVSRPKAGGLLDEGRPDLLISSGVWVGMPALPVGLAAWLCTPMNTKPSLLKRLMVEAATEADAEVRLPAACIQVETNQRSLEQSPIQLQAHASISAPNDSGRIPAFSPHGPEQPSGARARALHPSRRWLAKRHTGVLALPSVQELQALALKKTVVLQSEALHRAHWRHRHWAGLAAVPLGCSAAACERGARAQARASSEAGFATGRFYGAWLQIRLSNALLTSRRQQQRQRQGESSHGLRAPSRARTRVSGRVSREQGAT